MIGKTDKQLAADFHKLRGEIERRARVSIGDCAADIKGNELAKRVVTIAALGGHSVLFVGPPGSGKTMLRALALSLGNPLTFEAWPCPCGFRSSPRKPCNCTVKQIEKHVAKWPTADMFCETTALPAGEYLAARPGTTLAMIKENIERATPECSRELDNTCNRLIEQAISQMGLTTAQADLTINLATTIARLDGESRIQICHLAEAINYRLPAYYR